ncbi:MAG: CDGSH iron-sulfur domain-containing protein [Meiothermus sp.]|uniref:CDGSH iron-sulfur domain-containing protein n=1 Tax=Meiothermus sp. TaxID=1955249 RepID=UPI0025DF7AC0|nr:CDGSH iron-sulfur domain-containing protein [Meiothermus sp.]MCS7068505.1 CDGSH iron-sulfur domain-containing protein [Meiothermus sp.]MCX7601962.1 CDGSH iron-sulfur domain-containing protein [Meiothermus sp.]MDW8425267.1 CDGSH iron-sulfur domain-containing protein [Meiothermus sp.]
MKIRLRENGSLVLDLPEGTRFVLDGEERVLERAKLALCRCGHSEQKPFCDGSHKRVGFQAAPGEIELFRQNQENIEG